MTDALRNIAIIAHIDHGKTTLVDHMLRQTGVFRDNQDIRDCVLDSDDLERERGITILSKNTSVTWNGTRINIIDTPGHHDFSGEVERVLRMADGALLLVDAADGPMPQTRYVLQKALAAGLRLIVVINKMDRPEARAAEVVEEVQYLLLELEADDAQFNSPVLYAIGREGRSKSALKDNWSDLSPLFETILQHVPAPRVFRSEPFRLGVATLDYSDYVGRMAIGRIESGSVERGQKVTLIKPDGARTQGEVVRLDTFENLDRAPVAMAEAGEIVCIAGLNGVDIGDTVAADPEAEPLPFTAIDAPTLSMLFLINDSPLSGEDGEFLTSNYLRDRLMRETLSDPALKVEPTESPDMFRVSGRGLLHLSILIEKMRREGFELQVSRPEILFREIDGRRCEPIERAEFEIPGEYLGKVMELLGTRRGEVVSVAPHQDRLRIVARIPTRALLGLPRLILNLTRGQAIFNTLLDGYEPYRGSIPERTFGAMVAQEEGEATIYALDSLRTRGTFFLTPGTPVYEGMVVGEHVHDRDLPVNVAKRKRLTNMRAAAADSTCVLMQPRIHSLEEALEYINPDELVEVTPRTIRLRKKLLKEHLRRRDSRECVEERI